MSGPRPWASRPPEPPPEYPRLFVATPLDDAARAAVVALVDDVRAAADAVAHEPRSEVRWVRMDGLHLTIRFLGATEPGRVADVVNVVDEVASSTSAFPVTIAGAGAFPSAARPRTLWLGVDRGQSELGAIAAGIDEALVARGWAHDDRPFRAHLTLARADGRREGPFVARMLRERAEVFDAAFNADRIVLFESITGGGPARYVVVHEAQLQS